MEEFRFEITEVDEGDRIDKFLTENIDFVSVKKATKLVKSILKGKYVNDKNGERIYYDENRFVKLIQASSGQQESLWIVLLIFSVITLLSLSCSF